MRFSDLTRVEAPPADPVPAARTPVETDSYLNQLLENPQNNGFVSAMVDRRRSRRMHASRRGFIRGSIAVAAAATAATAAGLFGPARRVEAQGSIVGTYPRRILQFCPPYNSGDNCQPGCGSSPICTDCCGADGFFRNDPGNGYSLYAGGCGDGDIADGWIWRYKGKCGSCSEIEYRCSDGFVQTDSGPAPFICRAVTDCVPLADGEAPGADLTDAARRTNWNPAGRLELAVDNGGGVVTISGWIADGTGTPLGMRIRANNSIIHLGRAALGRPDVAAAVRGAGPNTGFSVSFSMDPGRYEFCVDALSGLLSAKIGCVSLNVGSGGAARGSGTSGGGSSSPSPAPAQPVPQPTPTPLVLALPEEGPETASPAYGAVQVARRVDASTGFVSGWAGDPDTDANVYVDVQVNSESVATLRTDLPRPDVAAAFVGQNSTTGFAITFPLPAEPAELCVDAVSPDDGRRRRLICARVGDTSFSVDQTESSGPSASGSAASGAAVVYGAIDNVTTGANGVEVTGWCFDPNDRGRPISVTASASDVVTQTTTNLPHPVAQAVYGLDHHCGFRSLVELPAGRHQVIVTATDRAGASVELGQRTVVVL